MPIKINSSFAVKFIRSRIGSLELEKSSPSCNSLPDSCTVELITNGNTLFIQNTAFVTRKQQEDF